MIAQLPRLMMALLVGFVFVQSSAADITFNSPATDTTIAHCEDYFLYEWDRQLNMSDAAHGALYDVPQNQSREVDGFTYADGILSFNTTGPSAPLTLLSYTPWDSNNDVKGALPIGTRYGETLPIDTSRYRYFVTRMYASQTVWAQILWSESTTRFAITAFLVSPGWNTYRIDLANASISNSAGANVGWQQGNWEGLEFYPVNVSGIDVRVDFMELQSDSPCGSTNIDYTITPTSGEDYAVIVVDSDLDPQNGIVDSTVTSSSATGTLATGAGYYASGTYHAYGFLSSDWASLYRPDPFDMSQSSDIDAATISQITGPSFSGGAFIGTTSGSEPHFDLNFNHEIIPAALFPYISLGLNLTFPEGVSSDSLTLTWYNASDAELGDTTISTSPGSQVYNISLGSSDNWLGDVAGLRIKPATRSGVTFSLDFMAIRSSGYVSDLSLPTLTNAGGDIIVQPLSLSFRQPDHRGGSDFAQTELGNSWNMNSSADMTRVENVQSAYIYPDNELQDPAGVTRAGDFLLTTNITGNGDPQAVPYRFVKSPRIDTRRYVNLCYNGWNTTESNNFNSVARVGWHNAADPLDTYTIGDDIVMARPQSEYCMDLRNNRHTQTEPPHADDFNPWTSISENGSSVDLLRVDMTESIEAAHSSVLDYIHLRSDHEANTQYALVIEAPLSQQVDLYYTASRAATGGSSIGSLDAGRNTNVFKWDTTNVPEGLYYIYGTVSAGGNTLARLAGGRVDVDHARAQDTAAPVLNCERPSDSYTFDSQLEVAGYAMDETRLATLEVFMDGEYLTSITPDKFHVGARDAYPAWAEANNPGFQEFITEGLPAYGEHTMMLVATDTAGNETSCSSQVTRAIGADTPALEYPAHNASPVEHEDQVAPEKPRLSAKLLAGGGVRFSILYGTGCDTVSLVGSKLKNFLATKTIKTTSIVNSKVITMAGLSKFKKPSKKKADDGLLYFRAVCGRSNEYRNTVRFDSRKIKATKKVTTEAKVLSQMVKKAK